MTFRYLKDDGTTFVPLESVHSADLDVSIKALASEELLDKFRLRCVRGTDPQSCASPDR